MMSYSADFINQYFREDTELTNELQMSFKQ